MSTAVMQSRFAWCTRSGRIPSRGFTLFELLVTVAIVAILGAIALPSFSGTMRNDRMTTEANDLISAINLARTEAVTRAAPVTVCASVDGTSCSADTAWNKGWIVFLDYGTAGTLTAGDGDKVLRVWSAIDPQDSITTTSTYLQFAPAGTATDATTDFSSTTFTLKPSGCTSNQMRVIQVMAMGRTDSQQETCS